jgi:uncharacterized damage-inducible protein DinB
MNDLRMLKELFGHMEWADALVFKAVMSHAEAAGDAKMRELLFHLHMVQRLFLTVWQRESVTAPPSEAPDLVSVGESARAYYADLGGFLSRLDGEALTGAVVVPWAGRLAQRLGREPDAPTLAETCLQVAMHSTYHRGQINARLRAIGGEPPLTDFIAWVWFGKPDAEWPDPTG